MIAHYSADIEKLMGRIEHIINLLVKDVLHRRGDSHPIFFDIFTYGGKVGLEHRYINLNSKNYLSKEHLKTYFNGMVRYINKLQK
jgi:hypothetical protein